MNYWLSDDDDADFPDAQSQHLGDDGLKILTFYYCYCLLS